MARTPNMRTDTELLTSAPVDSEAFGVFYDRYERSVLGYFVRRTRRGDLAADLAAETFAIALTSVRKFDASRGEPGAWLFGIARHVLLRSPERSGGHPTNGRSFDSGLFDYARRADGTRPGSYLHPNRPDKTTHPRRWIGANTLTTGFADR